MPSEFKIFQGIRKTRPRQWFAFVMLGVVALDADVREEIVGELNEALPPEIVDRVGDVRGADRQMKIYPDELGISRFSRDVMRLLSTTQVRVVNRAINSILREKNRLDWFGTEGQCDPRGDQRC